MGGGGDGGGVIRAGVYFFTEQWKAVTVFLDIYFRKDLQCSVRYG